MIGDGRVDQVVKQQIYEDSHSEVDGELLKHSDCWFLPKGCVMSREDATLCMWYVMIFIFSLTLYESCLPSHHSPALANIIKHRIVKEYSYKKKKRKFK